VPDIQAFYYPDAVVIFEIPEYYKGRKDVILNPLLIVEVASSSTESHDRGQKFVDYALLPSFREYLMVMQDSPLVRISRRTTGNLWQMETIEGADQSIQLTSIGYPINMSDIYFRTEHL
jgi:Uma2 family endonuclease